MSQQVVIKLLPDGSGRVRIHYFVHASDGPVQTRVAIHATALGPLKLGGARGYIACMPKLNDVTPQIINGASVPICHSDDPRAATCPECLATKEAQEVLAKLAEILEVSQR